MDTVSSPTTLTKTFNVATDMGILISTGRALLFWTLGPIPQALSLGALGIGTYLKIRSEFGERDGGAHDALNWGTHAQTGMGINTLYKEKYVAASTAFLFTAANLSFMGDLDKVKEKLTALIGEKPAQVITQRETFSTFGLGSAAYMAGGSTGLLSFIPTAIGGCLALKNTLYEDSPLKNKPLLWTSGGLLATASAEFYEENYLKGLAHIFFRVLIV